jgi:glycosyltransferase involved in cell wall biosynthesis
MKKLAIVVTHPIQYYVPVFKLLAKKCDLKIFYTWGEKGAAAKYDPDFDQIIDWDIPLLDGYEYEFVTNTSKEPGSHHFNGIKNPDLVHKINQFRPDALFVYGWAYQSHLKVIRKLSGKYKIWFRGDSTLLDEIGGIKSIFKNIFLRLVYQNIDKAFFVGTANKNYFKYFGLKPSQLIYLPHAVDNQRFSLPQNDYENTIRKSLNILQTAILILFVGKLEQKKDPEILLKAFKALNHKNAHLLFVGNGKLSQKMKKDVSDQAIKNVHFLNFQNQSQMPNIYQASDLLCLPSKGPGETWGLTINEAMAANCAILTTEKVGSNLDLVKDGINGYVFEAGNLSALKTMLNQMMDKDLLKNQGIKSGEIIKDFTFDKQVEIILSNLAIL